MEKITMFKAKDGKIFDDEYDCQEYEFKLSAKSIEGEIALFDSECLPLPLDGCGVDNAFYVRIDTKEAFDWFKDTLYHRGAFTEGLYWYGKPDIYLWDGNRVVDYVWHSWSKIVEGVGKERDKLIQSGIFKAWG